MKVIDDGIIKYDRSNFTHCGPINVVEYSKVEHWRKIFFKLNLIGEYANSHIGFGNISEVKDYSQLYQSSKPQFIITGTQTGKYSDLDGKYYTRVLDYEIDHLKISSMGPTEASSEALTHAAIYTYNSKVKAVVHIHSSTIWNGMIQNEAYSTPQHISYGTLEMAQATKKCVSEKNYGSFYMHGHEDGVIAFGQDLEEASQLILTLYYKYK